MEDADRLGFMPRKRSFAFLNAARLTTPAAFIHTAAHELGHGVFHLQHIFDRFPDLRPGATNNLMDYGDSTTLYKYQWDNIHDPESNFSLFDEEGEGASELTTIDVYLVNDKERSHLTDYMIKNRILPTVKRILARNGFGEKFNYHILDLVSMQQLPKRFRETDRSLFLGFTNGRNSTAGSSSINNTNGVLGTWWEGDNEITISSGLEVLLCRGMNPNIISPPPPPSVSGFYIIALIVAHELCHQLDAFALMRYEGSLENYPSVNQGHYFGEVNLLLPGSQIPKEPPGGSQELLLPFVKERIIQYAND